MCLDKSRMTKLGDSSRKFIPEKERKARNDPFVERIARTRTDKGNKVSSGMVETRSQKSSEGQKAILEVEVQHDDAWRDGETANVLLVFRKSEEHFGKLLSIYHGNGYRQSSRNPVRR